MKFNKILAVVDYAATENFALERAFSLASKNLTKGEVVQVSVLVIHPDNVTQDDAEIFLSELLPNREFLNYYVSEKQALDFIIEKANNLEFDLLVKQAKEQESLLSLLVTPFDWQLLRKCPCPIMLVKSKEWIENGKILVAVNVSDTEEYHEAFNVKLVDTGTNLSTALDYQSVELVNAYPPAPLNIAIDLPEFNPVTYGDNVRSNNLVNMKKLRQEFSIDDEHTHVHEGIPEEVIPSVATKINANIVILGTIGRTGLSAIFLGNTAEHLIERLNCDLIGIKPDVREEKENSEQEEQEENAEQEKDNNSKQEEKENSEQEEQEESAEQEKDDNSKQEEKEN